MQYVHLVFLSLTCAIVSRRLSSFESRAGTDKLHQLGDDNFNRTQTHLQSSREVHNAGNSHALASYLLASSPTSPRMASGVVHSPTTGRLHRKGSPKLLDASELIGTAVPLVASMGDALTGATTNGETLVAGTAAAIGGGAVDVPLTAALGGGAVDVLLAPLANAVTVTGDAIGGAATVAADATAAASNAVAAAIAPATGVAAVTSALSSYGKELEPQVEEWLQEAANLEDLNTDNVSSFMSVASWPRQSLYTFGECAFRGNLSGEQLHFPGARVVVPEDPVPNLVGQAVGYRHSRMVPVLELKDPNANSSAMSSKDDLQLQTALEEIMYERNLAVTDLWDTSTPVQKEDAPSVKPTGGVLSDLKNYGPDIFRDSDWGSHDMGVYKSRIKDRLLEHSESRKPDQELLQTYRMATLTRKMSYINANTSNVEAALETLNSEVDPTNPERLLFQDKLEHVMTFPFYTPCDIVSRALHPVGDLFGPQAPISREGIAHNVHLLRDSANNGYLTFQGTTNLATWVDINLACSKYDPERPKTPFDHVVDDKRWAMIEGHYLRSCHTGFCNTLKALVSNKRFPVLAKEVTKMKSITLLGHSFGGSLANMLVRSVHGAQALKKREGIVGRLRRLLRFGRRRKRSEYSPR